MNVIVSYPAPLLDNDITDLANRFNGYRVNSAPNQEPNVLELEFNFTQDDQLALFIQKVREQYPNLNTRLISAQEAQDRAQDSGSARAEVSKKSEDSEAMIS